MQKTGKSQSKVSPFLKNLRDKTRKIDIDFNAPLLTEKNAEVEKKNKVA